MLQKINPYLRPLYDALFDLVQADQANRLIERGIIEIAPLAFMRGRTLNSAFIILDEAQNTTKEQMKMLLTRAGFDSKVVITADITQIDLPQPAKSGVLHAIKILSPIKEIAFCYFNEKDVVRHPLVQKIIKAYQKAEAKAQSIAMSLISFKNLKLFKSPAPPHKAEQQACPARKKTGKASGQGCPEAVFSYIVPVRPGPGLFHFLPPRRNLCPLPSPAKSPSGHHRPRRSDDRRHRDDGKAAPGGRRRRPARLYLRPQRVPESSRKRSASFSASAGNG